MGRVLAAPFLFSLILLSSLFLGASPLKIASWNVENLFDMQRDGTEYPEFVPGRHGWTQRVLEKKLDHLSEVICDLDADVLALQEVESDGVLARLQRRLRRVGCPYPYRYITRDPATPIHNALLSRKKLRQMRDLKIAISGRYRSILEAVLPGSRPLYLFVNHWRSKSAPESERIRYALALKRRLEKLPKGSEYLLIGDFNSDYQEYRVIEKKHNDRHGRTGINHVLETIRPDGELLRRRDLHRLRDGKLHHYNLWLELPSPERWSHDFYGDREAIDGILIPPTLLDGRHWEYLPESFGVFRPRYLIGKYGAPRRWQIRHGRHTGRGYSDHLPVYALFEDRRGEGLWDRAGRWLGLTKSSKESRDLRGTKDKGNRPQEIDIARLNRLEKLGTPRLLGDAVVVFKRGTSAVLQRRAGGEAILVYKGAAGLEEGRRYDLIVHGFKRYRGMPELTDLEIVKAKGRVPTDPFISTYRKEMIGGKEGVSRIVKDLEGIYRQGRLETAEGAVPVYFKGKRWRPKEGSRLKIKRAQIGYYKDHKELVVWDRRDFELLPKKE
ncbi:endonuclease/exonuclease/phosphatase family protein [Nitratifractor sp.]